jgi:poly(3-hydroxybutyrate) depolymerase
MDAAAPDAGDMGAPYPGAKQTVATWAAKNRCTGDLTDSGERVHLDSDAQGMETIVARYAGCTPNGAAELWTVPNAGHVIAFTPESLDRIWLFLSAHPKP